MSADWKQIAREAWQAPSWREAAIEYHKERPALASPSSSRSRSLLPSDREICRAAGQCIRRKAPRDGLRTFLEWCDRHDVSRADALSIFKIIVDRELAR